MLSYRLFQAGLFPFLPFLIAEAKAIRKSKPIPPAQSNHLILGSGDKKLLIFGESTAAGVGASKPEKTLAGQISLHFGQDSQVINLGKNGLQAKDFFNEFGEEISNFKGHVEGVFLFMGANDCFRLTEPSNYKSLLLEIINHFQKNFSPEWIYLAAIPPVNNFPAFSPRMQFFLRKQRTFLTKKMEEIKEIYPNIIFEEIDLKLSTEFFASDGVHPSDMGYEAIAQFAIDGIKRWQAKV